MVVFCFKIRLNSVTLLQWGKTEIMVSRDNFNISLKQVAYIMPHSLSTKKNTSRCLHVLFKKMSY
uniref:Uncharacterized protein n=1 Tax=Anguilla anguilla TaxID=7936 RepID=A0A0E9Q9Y4_ANGAN